MNNIKEYNSIKNEIALKAVLEILLYTIICMCIIAFLVDGVFNDTIAETINNTDSYIYYRAVEQKPAIIATIGLFVITIVAFFIIRKNMNSLTIITTAINEIIKEPENKVELPTNLAIIENKLNNIIPVILKYAGGINFFKNDNNNPNNLLPIVTALENNNYEAAKLFFDKTGSLFAQMYTLDGVKVSLIDYLFYNVMDEEIKKADIPVNTFFKSLINGYKQSGTGIKEIKTMLESGNLTTVLDTPLAVENGELPAGATVAHIAAAMEYHALLKAMAFYNEKTEILNIQDSNGDTPLHTAVRAGNLSTAKILLEGGAFIDKVNYNGLTPLAVVIKEYNGKNQAALVRLLLTSAGNTTSRYDLMPDDKTIEIFENAKNIKTVNDILNKYNIKTENIEARGYLLSESKRYAEKELNPQIVRIMKGGIDNQLPFAVYMYEIPPFPKDATPLIAAAIACSENTARNLILAKANTDIRITGENDLKYDAYDFADRVSKCEPVKAILKNPSSLKIDIEDLLAWDVEQPAEYNTAEEDAYTVEKNNDDSSKNENSDVELIIEEPVQ